MSRRNRPLTRKQRRGLDSLLKQVAEVREAATGGKKPGGETTNSPVRMAAES